MHHWYNNNSNDIIYRAHSHQKWQFKVYNITHTHGARYVQMSTESRGREWRSVAERGEFSSFVWKGLMWVFRGEREEGCSRRQWRRKRRETGEPWLTAPPASSLCTYQPSRSLRSSKEWLLKIPKKNTKTFSERSFSYTAQTVWTSLPDDLRASSSLQSQTQNISLPSSILVCTWYLLPVSYPVCVCVCVCVCLCVSVWIQCASWQAQWECVGWVVGGGICGQELRLILFMWSECSCTLFFPCTSFSCIILPFVYTMLT